MYVIGGAVDVLSSQGNDEPQFDHLGVVRFKVELGNGRIFIAVKKDCSISVLKRLNSVP